jgi:four helix bundle protein
MDTHRKLDVWMRAGDLVRVIYRVTDELPSAEFQVATPQLRRAAWSVQNNIAEGNARVGRREMKRFFDYALASPAEVDSMRCTLPTLYPLDETSLREVDELRWKITAGVFALLKRGRR